jgi:uncharacterized LabA/DUF88 family protein
MRACRCGASVALNRAMGGHSVAALRASFERCGFIEAPGHAIGRQRWRRWRRRGRGEYACLPFPDRSLMASASTTLAVLIDADNAQPAVVDGLLAEIAKYGTATVKRIYGDWTGPQLKGWKETLLTHAIQPIQQFRYTTGKNATDSALIIDAMDLLYTGRLGGFCIVSSDSDFTRLAARIREAGLVVYGFGEKKTPAPFVSACDKFIYTEILLAKDDEEGTSTLKPRSATQLRQDRRFVALLRNAAEASSDDAGWSQLGTLGSTIAKQAPEFDARNYGYRKLSELVAASGLFDIEKRKSGDGATTQTYVRMRQRSGRSEAAAS